MSIDEKNSGYNQTRFSEIPNSVTEEGFEEYERQVPKPRLSHYKALLSYDNPDLEKIINAFTYWSNYVEYLVFRRENIHTNELTYKMAKAAKRGNDVYSAKLRKRLNHLYILSQIEFFNYKERGIIQKTRVVFFTLTYARNERLDVLWEEVGKDFNRWRARF